MARSRKEKERLHRLTGGDRGGGLPLPLLFSAILEELLDWGGATTVRLNEITASTLDFKAGTVEMTWRTLDGRADFEALATDVLEQMESREVIKREDGAWHLGPAFKLGEYIEVIPGGKGRQKDGTTVWDEDEREARSRQSMTEFDAASVIERPNPVEHDVVAWLRESAGTVGHQYPVLTDRSGRIIDGHHRKQADPNWPTQVARRKDGTQVETEAEMLALIRDLDIRRPPLPAETKADIDRILGELAGTNAIRRDRIEAELKRDASRSNREIAEGVGVDDKTVGTVRDELRNFRSIHDYQFKGGRGARTGRHSASCWCGEGTETPKTPAASGPAQPRKVDDPALRAEIRQQLSTGVHGEDISQVELCDRFRVGQYVAAQAVAKETERFLRERMPSGSAPAPPEREALTAESPSRELLAEVIRRLPADDKAWLLREVFGL